MTNIKCDCGKIICQREKNYLVIKCRHCKRLVVMVLNGETKENILIHPDYNTYYDKPIQL